MPLFKPLHHYHYIWGEKQYNPISKPDHGKCLEVKYHPPGAHHMHHIQELQHRPAMLGTLASAGMPPWRWLMLMPIGSIFVFKVSGFRDYFEAFFLLTCSSLPSVGLKYQFMGTDWKYVNILSLFVLGFWSKLLFIYWALQMPSWVRKLESWKKISKQSLPDDSSRWCWCTMYIM